MPSENRRLRRPCRAPGARNPRDSRVRSTTVQSGPHRQAGEEAPSGGSLPVEIGAVVNGKYRIERVLGRAAMGVVVAARSTCSSTSASRSSSSRRGARATGDAVARFLREARAAVKLKSEHVGARARRGHGPGVGRALHRDGVPGGAGLSARRSSSNGRLLGAGRRRVHAPGVRGARRGARQGHRPPRHQAGEPVPRDDGARTARRWSRCSTSAISKAALTGCGAAGISRCRRARSWARRSTCRPSRCVAAATSTRAPTSGRSASCSTSCSRGPPPSRPRHSRSSASPSSSAT